MDCPEKPDEKRHRTVRGTDGQEPLTDATDRHRRQAPQAGTADKYDRQETTDRYSRTEIQDRERHRTETWKTAQSAEYRRTASRRNSR